MAAIVSPVLMSATDPMTCLRIAVEPVTCTVIVPLFRGLCNVSVEPLIDSTVPATPGREPIVDVQLSLVAGVAPCTRGVTSGGLPPAWLTVEHAPTPNVR